MSIIERELLTLNKPANYEELYKYTAFKYHCIDQDYLV
jgi:hypothetical protein